MNKKIKFIVLFFIAIAAIFLISRYLFLKTPCANSISCTRDLRGNYNPAKTVGEYSGQNVNVPQNMFDNNTNDHVQGAKTSKLEKKILIDLTTQKLYAYEGQKIVYNFLISSGKWVPTPSGKFYIWTKLLATDMEGGEKLLNTYYNLPNVPYTMFFYNEFLGKWAGYGIHGAYWHADFGKPASHGCVALSVADAAKLFYWADAPNKINYVDLKDKRKGTPVIIFGKATSS